MKKTLKPLYLLLMIFVCAIMISCHGARKTITFDVPEEFDMSRNYEISFWSKNDSNISQFKIYQKAIEDFEKIYPNIKVVIKQYTNYNDIYNDVITNIATNTTPNICISYPDHVATYLTGNNIVVPLDDIIVDEKYGLGGSEIKFDGVKQNEVVSKFLNENIYNGHYYGLPFMRSTEACYLNVDYIERLGFTIPEKLTWDWVWEVSEKALEQKEENQVLIPFIYKSTDNMMIQMLKQKHDGTYNYSNDNGEIFIFNETTREILKEIGTHGKSRAFSTFGISSYPGNFFNIEECIIAVDSTAGATWMGSNSPSSDIHNVIPHEFETKVMTIPQYNVDNPKMISQGPSICLFNKEDKQEVLASWLFMQFLLTNDVQISYAQTEGYIPVTTKAQEDSTYLDYLSRAGEDNNLYYKTKIDASKLLLEHIEDTFVTSVFNGSTSLRNAAGQMIENVVKAGRKKKDINDELIDTVFEEVKSLYKLDQIQTIDGNSTVSIKTEFGKLPNVSIIALCTLGAVWVIIIAYLLNEHRKKRKIKR